MHQGRDEQEKARLEKIKALQRKVDETKEVMQHNIALAMERGALLEDLVDSTGRLAHDTQIFSRDTIQLEEKTYFQNLSISAVFCGMTLGLLYGAFSGFYWPFLLVAAAVGGAAGYMVMWMASAVMQTYHRYGTFDGLRHELASRVSHVVHPAPRPAITPLFENSVSGPTLTPSPTHQTAPTRAARLIR